MAFGVLKRKFSIINDVYRINLSKGTRVRFGVVDGTPTVTFDGSEVRMIKVDGKWLAEVFGCLMTMNINPERMPYPLSYFKSP